MLEEKTVVLMDGVDEVGNIRVKTITRIFRDGEQVGSDSYHRHVLSPTDDLSQEAPHIRAIAEAVRKIHPVVSKS